jgi:hypothetical protein
MCLKMNQTTLEYPEIRVLQDGDREDSHGMWYRVEWQKFTSVSESPTASILSVEEL